MQLKDIPLSVLDVVPLRRGSTAAEAMRETLELAKHCESLGYARYWFAEHHGMGGIASSAPAVLIARVASITSTMRIGSGGVMLPNHSSLAIAEQFGTLEALFPGRIDLGIGRAPGTDGPTARVLRRNAREDDLPVQLNELFSFFRGDFPREHPYASIEAVPARGNEPPVWLLGSSGFSAQLAGHLGLPFAFAHHFSQENTLPALKMYRDRFRPSKDYPKPHAMIGAFVVVADTDAQARKLALPTALSFLRMQQGVTGASPTLEEVEQHPWTPRERAFAEQWIAKNVVGDPESVRAQLTQLIDATHIDELMVLCVAPDKASRMRSYTLLKALQAGA